MVTRRPFRMLLSFYFWNQRPGNRGPTGLGNKDMTPVDLYWLKVKPESHRRHEVEFHGHGDNIEANDCGDGKIEIFARAHLMKPGAPRRVVQPVWKFRLVWWARRETKKIVETEEQFLFDTVSIIIDANLIAKTCLIRKVFQYRDQVMKLKK